MAAVSNDRYKLSFGALKKILEGEVCENVILQILGYKQIPGSNNNRFRMLLNDGVVLFPYAILATHLNNLVYDKLLEKYTILKLKSYEFSQLIANKKVIICIDVEVLVQGSEVNEKISQENFSVIASTCNLNDSVSMSRVPNSHSSSIIDPYPSTADITQNWDIAHSTVASISEVAGNIPISLISSLSPYRRKWTIKARVSYKSQLVNYSNMKGQGKYFSFYLLDDSGEIRAVAFNFNAEKFYNLLEVFKIYYISHADVKPAQENSPIKCDFEIVIDNFTKIKKCTENETCLPMPTFHFHTIKQITSLSKDSIIDIIGICDYISDVSIIMTKSNKQVCKRNISLVDSNKIPITVTLWGVDAENFTITGNHVIAVINAKVTNYGGFSLVTTPNSRIYIDPNIDKAFELKSWFQSSAPITSLSVSCQEASQNWKTFAEVFTENSYTADSSLYYTIKATVVMVKKEKCLYQACSSPGCNKKIIDLNNGLYRCNKCNKDYNTFSWSLILSLQVADFTGSHWVVAFKEVAERLIGLSCDELSKIKSDDVDKYYDILNNLNLKFYTFKMQSKSEVVNDEILLKTSILNFTDVDPISYTKEILTNIRKMSRVLNNKS